MGNTADLVLRSPPVQKMIIETLHKEGKSLFKECCIKAYSNNNNLLHLYSAILGTQSALHRRGESPQSPPMCSMHLDDATATILHQNAHHTPAYWWKGDKVMKPIGVWGWLGGHDGQRPMGKFGQELHPYSFSKDILGFLMTTECQDLGLTSHPKDSAFYSIVSPSLYWGIWTHTVHRMSTCWSH